MDRKLLLKYTDDSSRFLVIDGVQVHYRVEGKGMPLVLLHGAFSSLHTFDAWVEKLKHHYCVVRLDLLGFGLTGPHPEDNYSVANHIRFVRILLSRLGLERVSMAGSSLGGWLAWEYALAYPEQVEKLILIDSAGFIDAHSLPLPFQVARGFMGRVVRYVVRRSIITQFVRQVYHDQNKVTEELIDRYYELFNREGNPQAFVKLVNTRYRDNTRKLSQLRQPVLILWGAEDRWLSPNDAYLFTSALPHAELIVYQEIGHLPMEEAPEESVTDLIRFLRRAHLPDPLRISSAS